MKRSLKIMAAAAFRVAPISDFSNALRYETFGTLIKILYSHLVPCQGHPPRESLVPSGNGFSRRLLWSGMGLWNYLNPRVAEGNEA